MWFSYFIENTFVSSTIIIEDLFFVEIRKMMMVNLYVKRDSRYLINFKDPIIFYNYKNFRSKQIRAYIKAFYL